MRKATIVNLQQTEENGLFSLTFEGEAYSEFEKFILRFQKEASANKELQVILSYINKMLEGAGFLERYFRTGEGKMRDNVVALPIETGKLRLYCLRLSDHVLIAGGGGWKNVRAYQEDSNLNGYVITLQKLDDIIRAELRKGNIVIEANVIEGVEGKTFTL